MSQPLWERNLRTLIVNAERSGQPVIQVYGTDIAELIRELDCLRELAEHYKAAALAALEANKPLLVERVMRVANGMAPKCP
jgi:hypothetical protein